MIVHVILVSVGFKKNTYLGMMIVVDDGPHPIINIMYTHQHSLPV